MAVTTPVASGSNKEPSLNIAHLAALSILMIAGLAGGALHTPTVTMVSALAIVLFGLPHGAFDLQLLGRSEHGGAISDTINVRLLIAYLALIIVAIVIWTSLPALALLIFIIMASIHFGEDWHMVEAGLLRHVSGLSMVAAVTVASPHAVAALFGALTNDQFGFMFVQAIIMMSPVIGAFTIVAITLAVQRGHALWGAAQALAIIFAFVVPPIVAFAAYFILIHSAIHMQAARQALASWPFARFAGQGALLSIAAFAMALLMRGSGLMLTPDNGLPILIFQLLAVLTVPHLLLTHGWLPLPHSFTGPARQIRNSSR